MSQFFWKKSLILQVEPPEVAPGIKTLGDIEFMSIKEFQLKRVSDEAAQTATGTGAELTASGGKDLYLSAANVTVFRDTSDFYSVTAELQADGVPIETKVVTGLFNGGTSALGILSQTVHFDAKGVKVLAGQVLRIQITTSLNSTTESFIEGFEEDSGTSPQIAGTGGSSGGVGDIGFLAVKQFDNKLRTVEGTLTGTGTLVTITANPSRDMYIAGASLTWIKNIGSGTSNVEVELRINGIAVETYVARATAADPGGFHPYHFNQRGLMVAAGDTISLEVIALGTSSQIEGNLLVWEEDTGESPAPDGGGTTISGLAAGDVGFLALKDFGNKLFHELSATFSTTGVKISHIVPDGKTFYLYKAKVLPETGIIVRTGGGVGTDNDECKADVNYDSIPIDRIMHDSFSRLQGTIGSDQSGANLGGGLHTETGTVGLKLVGDGVKTVEIDVTAVSGNYKVLLEGWEEDTGTSPTA